MSMVDLKSKGITWVGDIYQKFGSIWDDADDVECQDTVKYVEGQVQSVKRFCTNVVQDLLPPRGDSVNHKGQRMLLKRNAVIGTYTGKTVNTEDFSVDTVLKKSLTDPMTADTVKDQFGELDLVNQLTPSSTEQTEDISTKAKSDVRMEENPIENKLTVHEVGFISPSEKQYFKSSLFSEVSDDNNENSSSSLDDVSPSTSVYGEKFEFSKVRTVNSYFAVDLECPAASSSTTYSEMECSALSSEKQVAEVGLVSPSSSRLTESYSTSGNSSENFPTNSVSYDEAASSDVSFTDRSNAVLSSTLTPMISSEIDAVGAGPISSNSVPLLESPIGFSEDSAADIFTDLGMETIDIITDPDMETIDLFDEVKGEESCVSVNSRELYAAAQRAQKMRSYKKKIQDAFASKKRLAKEYELLAIWFGDTDIGDTSRTSLSSTATAKPLDSRSLQTHHPSDSDWELL